MSGASGLGNRTRSPGAIFLTTGPGGYGGRSSKGVNVNPCCCGCQSLPCVSTASTQKVNAVVELSVFDHCW